jgi:DNA-binding response OmpR family regulator
MGGKRRVLIVEDNRDIREMMAELLQSRFNVTLAADGAEALEMLTRHRRKFDAIVVDTDMPELGGFALLSDLRERGLDVPALIVSGAPEARRSAREARADFMAKPFEVEWFEAKVDELLRKAS